MLMYCLLFTSRRRHTNCALVTGVQTCALPIFQNVGITRIDPVIYEGREIVPLQFLKAVLPEPSSLGETTKGKTNIGVIATGLGKDGKEKTLYLYNICDHEDAFAETGNQEVSYTTGVPAMIGAAMMEIGRAHG